MNSSWIITRRITFVLLSLCCYCCLYAIDNQEYFRFRRFSPQGGLCYQGVNSINQDKDGFIWFTTVNDLFMFDGYRTSNFSNHFFKIKSYHNWEFKVLSKNHEGELFVGTNHGLYRYENDTRQFTHLRNGSYVWIEETSDKILWFVCDKELSRYSSSDNQFKKLPVDHANTDLFSLSCYGKEAWFCSPDGSIYKNNNSNTGLDLYHSFTPQSPVVKMVASATTLYLLEEKGIVYALDKRKKTHETYLIPPELQQETNVFKELFVDGDKLWIGSRKGLYLIDIREKGTFLFRANVYDEFSIPNNSVWTIFKDKKGGIWIGTYLGGLCYYNKKDHSFKHYKNMLLNAQNHNAISSFAEDKKGNIWISTDGDGLYYFDRKKQTFCMHELTAGSQTRGLKNIKKIVLDKDKDLLYVAMFRGGIHLLDLKTGRSKRLEDVAYIKRMPTSISSLELHGDSGLWIGSSRYGIHYYNFRADSVLNIKEFNRVPDNLLSNYNVTNLRQDHLGNLWITTRNGLNRLDLKTGIIDFYYFEEKDPYSISGNDLFCTYEDSERNIWIGTNGKGLSKLVIDKGIFERYDLKQQLDANTVYGILEDDEKYIWVSTNNGLFRYDRKSNEFHHFDINDGIQGNIFYPNAYYKCSTGEMLFGGTNGFILFDPAKIELNQEKVDIIVSNIYVNGTSIYQDQESGLLKKYIKEQKIALNHNQNSLTFEFATDNYLIPQKTSYAYRLKGLNDEWETLRNGKRTLEFFDLREGVYFLEVKATNNDGVWSDQTYIVHIVKHPPFWYSIYAKIAYLFLFFVIIYIVLRVYMNRRNDKNQLKKEQFEKEKIIEMSKIKMNFFTNISHELRTPLTLISGNLKTLLKETPQESPTFSLLSMAYRNVYRLMTLISQLLDIRAIENNQLELKDEKGDLLSFLKDLTALFLPKIKESGLTLSFTSPMESFFTTFDPDKLEKILFNLLSNALKYTDKDGYIKIEFIQSSPSHIRLNVINQAVIAPDELEFVFNLFYHSKNKRSILNTSSGIGLAYTKELVEMMGGQITVLSASGETCFSIDLPLQVCYEESVTSETPPLQTKEIMEALDVIPKKTQNEVEEEKRTEILVVDDNADLLTFIQRELSDEFDIELVDNGSKALQLIKKRQFKVIITDVVMPGMTGYELCQKIKSDIETDHIPVIILTANKSDEEKIKGMQHGADVYISKPFDIEFLRYQIKNLLHMQDTLKKTFSQGLTSVPLVNNGTTNALLLEKAIRIVESHIDDSNFDVDVFASEMGIGRTVFYKKIKALTNLTVNEFILNIRLKKAAQLLLTTSLSISEVAYEVGFNDSSYFSTCFKRFFDESPKAYIASRKAQ